MGVDHHLVRAGEMIRLPNLVEDSSHSVNVSWRDEEVGDTVVAAFASSYPDSSLAPTEARGEKQNLHG